jgi:hypothetical protein
MGRSPDALIVRPEQPRDSRHVSTYARAESSRVCWTILRSRQHRCSIPTPPFTKGFLSLTDPTCQFRPYWTRAFRTRLGSNATPLSLFTCRPHKVRDRAADVQCQGSRSTTLQVCINVSGGCLWRKRSKARACAERWEARARAQELPVRRTGNTRRHALSTWRGWAGEVESCYEDQAKAAGRNESAVRISGTVYSRSSRLGLFFSISAYRPAGELRERTSYSYGILCWRKSRSYGILCWRKSRGDSHATRVTYKR